MNDILTVRDLSVHFRQGKRLVQLVDRLGSAFGLILGMVGSCAPAGPAGRQLPGHRQFPL